MRRVLEGPITTLVVLLLAASIPFGLGMAYYMNDERWLWFCLPLLIFLS